MKESSGTLDDLAALLGQFIEERIDAKLATLVDQHRYYSRKTWIAAGGEGSVFDHAAVALRSFRPGRRVLILRDELHEFVEKDPGSPRPPTPASASQPRPPRPLTPAEQWEQEEDQLLQQMKLRRPTDEERRAQGLPPYDRERAYQEHLEWKKKYDAEQDQKRRDDADRSIAAQRASASRAEDERRAKRPLGPRSSPRVRCDLCARDIPSRCASPPIAQGMDFPRVDSSRGRT